MLETGPDKVMGIFGAVSEEGTAEFVPIMRFEPTATAGATKEIPIRLVEPVTADASRAVHHREFLLDSGICTGQRPTEMGMLPGMCINGRTHDMARIDVETALGTTEVWKIVSRGMAHPFQLHGASFKVLSLGGAPPPAHLGGWKGCPSCRRRSRASGDLQPARDAGTSLYVSLSHPRIRRCGYDGAICVHLRPLHEAPSCSRHVPAILVDTPLNRPCISRWHAKPAVDPAKPRKTAP